MKKIILLVLMAGLILFSNNLYSQSDVDKVKNYSKCKADRAECLSKCTASNPDIERKINQCRQDIEARAKQKCPTSVQQCDEKPDYYSGWECDQLRYCKARKSEKCRQGAIEGCINRFKDITERNMGGCDGKYVNECKDGCTVCKLDLPYDVNLSNANLSGLNLTGVSLGYAVLDNVNLSDADMSSIDLSYASLKKADLSGAKISDARLGASHLEGADLSNADLRNTDMPYVYIDENTNFEGAMLDNANMMYPHAASSTDRSKIDEIVQYVKSRGAKFDHVYYY